MNGLPDDLVTAMRPGNGSGVHPGPKADEIEAAFNLLGQT